MHKLILTLIIFLLCTSALADENLINKYIPTAQKTGSGELHVLLWHAYTATLYAPNGKYSDNSPVALELKYYTAIKGKDIVERTIKEIKDQGFNDSAKLNEWKIRLNAIFPDVDEGTTLTGIKTDKGTVFFNNGKETGAVTDKVFSQKFFDIWLGEKTSQPKLRKQLLGQQNG